MKCWIVQAQSWINFNWKEKPWAEFSTVEVAACHARQLLPNLELKTQPKQLFGPLPAGPAVVERLPHSYEVKGLSPATAADSEREKVKKLCS